MLLAGLEARRDEAAANGGAGGGKSASGGDRGRELCVESESDEASSGASITGCRCVSLGQVEDKECELTAGCCGGGVGGLVCRRFRLSARRRVAGSQREGFAERAERATLSQEVEAG